MRDNILRDLLYNLSPKAGPFDKRYCQGIINGAVSALMADRNRSFNSALKIVCKALPNDYQIEGIPEPWMVDVLKQTGEYDQIVSMFHVWHQDDLYFDYRAWNNIWHFICEGYVIYSYAAHEDQILVGVPINDAKIGSSDKLISSAPWKLQKVCLINGHKILRGELKP